MSELTTELRSRAKTSKRNLSLALVFNDAAGTIEQLEADKAELVKFLRDLNGTPENLGSYSKSCQLDDLIAKHGESK